VPLRPLPDDLRLSWQPLGLAVDFLAMAKTEDQNDEAVVFDFADEPIWAYLVSPKFPQARALQRASDATRILQLGNSFMKELQDSPGVLHVKFSQIPLGLR